MDVRVDLSSARGALRSVPYMGVIWVVHEAKKLGFVNGHPDWCNLGQGQPEVGAIPGAPPRIDTIQIRPEDHAYGPLEGIDDLRAAVAAHYNRLFRQGQRAQYGPGNVAIAQGGRLVLSRAMAALGAVSAGYQLPDYTAYEDMLDLHMSRIVPVPVRTREADGFALTPDAFTAAVEAHGLGAFIVSNPCNPTGNVVAGEDLAAIVASARQRRVTLVMDEFYSHFHYTDDGRPAAGPVSAASFVEDVERDPVLVVDGLTKSFRYPGWRVGWVLGPSEMIEQIARTASALDGGPSRWAQRAAIVALEPERADAETGAMRAEFCKKRNLMVERLEAMGIALARRPRGTFYCWGTLRRLPPPLNDAMAFFRRALAKKVLTVPGEFFDVNPGKLRQGPSPYRDWMRFSFGPPMANLELGLDRLQAVVREAS